MRTGPRSCRERGAGPDDLRRPRERRALDASAAHARLPARGEDPDSSRSPFAPRLSGRRSPPRASSRTTATAACTASSLLSVEPGLVAEARGWFEDLLLYAALPRVAAVSAVVLDPNGLVEQAGAILGDEEGWMPAMRGWDPASDGYAGSLSCAREVSAVYGSWSLIAAREARAGSEGSPQGSPTHVSRGWISRCEPRARGSTTSSRPGLAFAERPTDPAAATAVDRWLVRDRWATVLGRGRPVPQSELQDRRRRLRPLNVLFVSHCNFDGQQRLPRACDRAGARAARVRARHRSPRSARDDRGRRPSLVPGRCRTPKRSATACPFRMDEARTWCTRSLRESSCGA